VLTLSIIVAAARNGVIGRNNALPWHLPEDLRYFKRVTMGKPVVMGRKTFEAIRRPLPGRTNIVISRQPGYRAEGLRVVASLEQALALAADIAVIDGAEELMVIGGAEIYRAALPLAQRIYLTEVDAEVEGDAFLPLIDWSEWREISRQAFGADDGHPYPYSFVVYERR
jgi:dihydrofolate reductase